MGDEAARVTINDVAAAAGVSRQTVSRALNDQPEISKATRERVLAAAQRLRYRPNQFARGMKTRRSAVVGLVVSDISNPFYPEVARGVFDAAEAHGRSVVVYNTDARRERERAALDDLLDRGADGAVGFFYATPETELARFAGQTRLVVADRLLRDRAIASVSTDFGTGTALAVRHLVDRGHRELAMLDSSVGIAVDERRVAFTAELLRLGLTAGDDRVVAAAPTIAGGAEAMRQLLGLHPTITAVFAFNDLMAFGAVRAAIDFDRSVPDQCAVVGFDDLSFAELVHPPLTTVHTDKYEQGRVLVDSLLAAAPARRVLLPVSLRVRETG